MKRMRRFLSILLAIVMIFGINTKSLAQVQSENEFFLNGYTIRTVRNNLNVITVSYTSEDGTAYLMSFDKLDRTMELEISSPNRLARNNKNGTYSVIVNEANPTIGEVSGISLVSETGTEYNLSKVNPRFAFVLPIGITLGGALIEVLLLIAGAVIIGGVAYVVAEEAISAIKKQKIYNYYDAVLKNNKIYIGNGISTNAAKGVMGVNSSTVGVFAISASYARGLCASLGGARYHAAHGSSSGFWDHYHSAFFPNAHCWYTY